VSEIFCTIFAAEMMGEVNDGGTTELGFDE
jgi:hypothetical protein